jgi:hypothetical protein
VGGIFISLGGALIIAYHFIFFLTRGRGIPRKTIRETIRKDLEINELEKDMVFDRTLWHCLIHVAESTKWDKARLLLLFQGIYSLSIVCHYCFIHLVKRIHPLSSSSIQIQSVSVYSYVGSITL